MLASKWMRAALVVLAAVVIYVAVRPVDRGQGRFFADQTYHFQTLRALNDVAADGADTAEVLETIKHIRSGDPQGWFAAWSATGERVAQRADTIADPMNKGRALLRAHNYYRTAEFFLPPTDPKRPVAASRNRQLFYAGLDTMGVRYQKIAVPYGEGHHLEAVYYPAAQGATKKKSLIVYGGGFDSTIEELYFSLVKDAHDHGYDVLTYDGPGQGAILREQDLPFTPEWEKPVNAVMASFLAEHPRPAKMVLVGLSLGGYLASRAAAFDDRFDGVVAHDVLFDLGAIGARNATPAVGWLDTHGLGPVVDLIVRVRAALSPGYAWASANGRWVTGTKRPLETAMVMKKFTLAGVAQKIKGDVLVMAGTNDHLVPFGQLAQFEQALTSARSVTTKVYDRDSGGAEHCQSGAPTLWHADLFDWLQTKFES